MNIENLPIDLKWPKGQHWIEWCLEGGEDFELVVSLPPKWAKKWLLSLPNSKLIGKIEAGPPGIFWSNGDPIQRIYRNNFKHFESNSN